MPTKTDSIDDPCGALLSLHNDVDGEVHPGTTNAVIVRELLRFALPTIAIMLLAGASLVVDTYFVTGLGSAALAGASLVFPMHLLMVMAFGGGIGVGLSVVLSVRIGRGEWANACRGVGSAFALALGLSFSILVAFSLYGRRLFMHMATTAPVAEAAVSFARPLFFGAPCIAACLTLSNVLRAEKRPREGAIMLLVSAAVNAVLNPILIYGRFGAPAMGIAGASTATVVGFFVSAVVGALYLRGGRFPLDARILRVDWSDLREMARIALPTLGTYAANQAASMSLSAVWARFGTDALAAFGLAGRFEYLLAIVIYGMGSAILTLGGQARGAGKHRDLTRICWIAATLVVATTSVLAIVLVSTPTSWFRMFHPAGSVVERGSEYVRITALSYPFYALALTLNYAYQTLALAYLPLFFSLFRGFGIAVPFALIAAAYGGSIRIAATGMAISMIYHGLVTATLLPRSLRRAR